VRAIEETYNKDLPLAIYLKKQKLPCAARYVVKEEPITKYAFAGGSKIATDRCAQGPLPSPSYLPMHSACNRGFEEAYNNKDPSLVSLSPQMSQIHVLPVT
jgi:hypothetical protein